MTVNVKQRNTSENTVSSDPDDPTIPEEVTGTDNPIRKLTFEVQDIPPIYIAVLYAVQVKHKPLSNKLYRSSSQYRMLLVFYTALSYK